MGKLVGIDLGTTYSVVAYLDGDRPRVIPNRRGRPTTPSVIYFGPEGILVGDDAKDQQSSGATEVASFFKRHMGEPHFVRRFGGKDYTPIALSALVLEELKRTAEAFFHEPVTDAVITVPAYFTHLQRHDTIEAGRRAGLKVQSIISEPTAAALAYGLRPAPGEQTVLVYDLGGGTFDISLVRIGQQELTVLGTDGDRELGGRDWDDRVAGYLQQRFENEFGFDPAGADFNELLTQAELLKRTLSERQSTQIRVQAGGRVGTYEMTREQFDALTRDLMERTQRLTESVLDARGLKWTDITGVLPVGGSSKMPMVREYVERMSGRPPMGGVNPDEAVGLGAAIWANLERDRASVPRYRLAAVRDVVAHSLGMIAESEDRSRYLNSVIIQKNLAIPATEQRPYTLPVSHDDDAKLEVFLTQGETDDPQECAFLGLYAFSDFPPLPEGKAVLDIRYSYDKNGMVSVAATERSTGKPLKLTVEPLPLDVPARFLGKPRAARGRGHVTVYLAVDLSGSMRGSPLAQAQDAARAFVSNCDLSTTAIGLIAFSDNVEVTQPATQNATEILSAINRLTCGQTGGGNRGQPFDHFYDSMQTAQEAAHDGSGRAPRSGGDASLRAEAAQPAHRLPGDAAPLHALPGASQPQGTGQRYGIVLTDGVWSHQSHAIAQAKRCHEAGIEIIAIGFGTADEQFLKDVAYSTEQGFFTDLGNLSETFTTIAQELTEYAGEGRVGSKLRKG